MKKLTSTDRGLISLLGKIINGLTKYGTSIPVTMVLLAQVEATLAALRNAASAYQQERDDLQASYDLFHPGMDELNTWLVTVRSILGRIIGETWSTAWAAAGFTNNSTAVPADNTSKIVLASSLETYFTNNPENERADSDVTAATAGTMAETMQGLEIEVMDAKQALRTSDGVLQPARATARSVVSTLIANLNKKLAPDDPRWIAFGLPMPASRKTPPAPEGVTVTMDSSAAVIVQCPPVPGATRYRCRILVVGVDTKYRLVFSGVDPMGMITTLLPGVTVQITMQAVNGNAQSVASEPVVFTVPNVGRPLTLVSSSAPKSTQLALTAPAVAATPKAQKAYKNGNGNGKSNGKSYAEASRLG